jgi:hypothetical protein
MKPPVTRTGSAEAGDANPDNIAASTNVNGDFVRIIIVSSG